jgi:hypothetical protein
MRRILGVCVTLLPAVLGVLSCGGDKQVEPKLAPQAAPPPERDPLEEDMFRVGQIRQLPVVRHVKMSKLDRSALARDVEAYVKRETPTNFIEGQGAILKLLGMVPQNFDYLAANIALMKAQLAGYYDPTRQTMVLANDLGKDEESATLLHELVHALQDQNFDLGNRLKQTPLMGDKLSALHTLAEGDATSAMLGETLRAQGYDINQLSDEMLAERMRQDFSTQNPEVPGVIKRAALAPYLDGLTFVNELRRSGGWKLVDRTWADPPQSTEQLLHPEKHAAKEGFRSFNSPAAPKPGCELVYEDVIGEQGLKVVFEEWVSPSDAEAAAEGWDGDRATVFKCGEQYALLWRISYDQGMGGESARGIETFRAGIPHCRPAVDQVARTVRQVQGHVVVAALQGGDATCADLTSWIESSKP